MTTITVLGTGSCLPDRVVTNDLAGAAAGADDAWIWRKTGIRRRRWAHPGQATSDLAAAAARRALAASDIDVGQVSALLVATSTPDRPQPPTAAYVQAALGTHNAAAFDINAVCSGFVFALATGYRLVADTGGYALVVGADIYSRILNPADRKTVILFGDGAGAVLLGPDTAGRGILASRLHTFGDLADTIHVPAGGSRDPFTDTTVSAGRHYFTMDGPRVREFVSMSLPGLVKQFLCDHNVLPQQIDHVVPHQANGVLLDQVLPELGLPAAQEHRTLTEYGNTGAASIPITLDHAANGGALNAGDLVLLIGFGGGMSVAMALLEWPELSR